MNRPSVWTWIALGLAAAAIAALGMLAGSALRGSRPEDSEAVVFRKAFVPGSHVPDVPLIAPDGRRVGTRDLIRDRGAVVLFLDPNCESCHSMVSEWQVHVASDSLGDVPLFGIALASPDSVAEYRRAHGVTLPVYADTAWTFMRRYRVTAFPLRLVVGRSGVVRSAEIDPYAPVNAADVHRWLAE